MDSRTRDLTPGRFPKHASLEPVLKKSKTIKNVVARAATELESVNQALQEESIVNAPSQTVNEAIAQNMDVEVQVAKAADDLSRVNTQLAKKAAQQVSMAAELAHTKSRLTQAHDELTQSRAQEKQARQKALQDPLTGLANRVSFDQALDHSLIQARRHGWQFAVLFLDIDEFKSINDSSGHDVGDKVLLMVAERLQSSLREADTVCRWGGDEFVCLLLEVHQEGDVRFLANALLGRIAEDWECDGTVFSVQVSIGIALYPADGETAESLFKNADTAMFRAKGTKKKVEFFHGSR